MKRTFAVTTGAKAKTNADPYGMTTRKAKAAAGAVIARQVFARTSAASSMVSTRCCCAILASNPLLRTVNSRLRYAVHVFTDRLWKPYAVPAWHVAVQAILHHPRIAASIVAAVILLIAGIWWFVVSRRPSAEEIERRRREYLATHGRITDGFILDARTLTGEESLEPAPEVLVYSYRLAGVTYNCAQDVSMLPEQVRGYRLDQPISVRYDQRHPGNSILVSETWSGLWQR